MATDDLIPDPTAVPDGSPSESRDSRDFPGSLDGYLTKYGGLLGEQAQRNLAPLHIPGRDEPCRREFLRAPFEPQAHVIAASVKALDRQNSILICGTMGTGKTILGMATAHDHAGGKPYRALVFCPGQLCAKWERELVETIPGVRVVQLENWKKVAKLRLAREFKPSKPTWYIIARDRAKLGAKWKPAAVETKRDAVLRCPACGGRISKRTQDGEEVEPVSFEKLKKNRMNCPDCKGPLWQFTREIDRWEPAAFIKRKLKGFFDYLILDEVHETKSATTAQGNASGSLAASAKKVIALTGTLIGGYAEHLRPLLFRLAPTSLVDEGLGWSDATAFNDLYGRMETRVTVRDKDDGGGDDNRMSRGSSRSKVRYSRPGIMPTLFGKHLIDKTIFLGLEEVANNLPELEETVLPVEMDAEQKAAYDETERDLMGAVREMIRKNDRRLLGAMLQTLSGYPDMPWGWGHVGYKEGETFITVASPPDLDKPTIRPKERALLNLCKQEVAAGRQVWVYVQMTDKHDVAARLEKLLAGQGLRTKVLRAAVQLDKREEWIAKNGPTADVVISHPKLVETGLDLFDKKGGHNFSTLVFYETGYNLFTLRQASRRAWRIGQKQKCRVVYMYYSGTMQEKAMGLMGKKLTAAQAVEGKFSSEGLAAMAGDDEGETMALARSLSEKIDHGNPARVWAKFGETTAPSKPVVLPFQKPEPAAESDDWLADLEEEELLDLSWLSELEEEEPLDLSVFG